MPKREIKMNVEKRIVALEQALEQHVGDFDWEIKERIDVLRFEIERKIAKLGQSLHALGVDVSDISRKVD